MSAIKFELDAEVRTDLGRGASRRLRRADKLPAVVYGAGEQALSLVLDHNKVRLALAHEAFYSHILTLNVNNKPEKVILKTLQRHPTKPRYLHLDFLRVRADQKLTMHVPLHFKGQEEAPGLKEGGVFSHHISDLEISCLPANLPEYLEVNVSQMALNDVLHLSHLKLPKGIEIVAFAHGVEGHDLPVVSLTVPRVVEEETVEPTAEEAASSTEETTSSAEATVAADKDKNQT